MEYMILQELRDINQVIQHTNDLLDRLTVITLRWHGVKSENLSSVLARMDSEMPLLKEEIAEKYSELKKTADH